LTNAVPTIAPDATVKELIEVFTNTDAFFIPVVDADGNYVGSVALEEVKVLFLERDTWSWIIVNDILNPERESLPADIPLQEGLQRMKQLHTNQIAVQDQKKYCGILDVRMAQQFVRKEMLKLRSDV
jgi:CBS domain-containing protein